MLRLGYGHARLLEGGIYYLATGGVICAAACLPLSLQKQVPPPINAADRLLPAVKVLDCVLPVPGMSLIMVGRKPGLCVADRGECAALEDSQRSIF